MRTYGDIHWNTEEWVIRRLEPQVAIRLKQVFEKLPKWESQLFFMGGSNEIAHEIDWFMQRYPLKISEKDKRRLKKQSRLFVRNQNELGELLKANYTARNFKINGKMRRYQRTGTDLYLRTQSLLIGDEVGLGKTLQAIASFTEVNTLPALVVMQAHLPNQWKEEIERFIGARVHIVRTGKPYKLPEADVYVSSYHKLQNWVDVWAEGKIKSVVFDEIQELRRDESNKYRASRQISKACDYRLGLSATPVYNYGDEIYSIMNILKPGCLGSWAEFRREWCGMDRKVKNPEALGAYLREKFLFIRRTADQVKRQLPPVNKIVHTVDHDSEAVKRVEDVAKRLAMKVTTGTFIERGEAARELDVMMRKITGVSKARFVAEYVKILLDNDEPVLLVGWHRDVYEIWLKELKDYKPVMYTGTETGSKKDRAKKAFMDGESNLLIMSLRSGIGLDGLQHRCKYVVFGELDWSPAVHEQVTGRVRRDGQKNQVTSIYLVSEGGSDPMLVDMLGVKASQARGIVDPFSGVTNTFSDDSRIKALANFILNKGGSADGIKNQKTKAQGLPEKAQAQA